MLIIYPNGAVAEPAPTKVADTKIHSPERNRSTKGGHLHTSTYVASYKCYCFNVAKINAAMSLQCLSQAAILRHCRVFYLNVALK